MGFFGQSRVTSRDGRHQKFTPAQLRAARQRELRAAAAKAAARKDAKVRRMSRNLGNPNAKKWTW